MADPIFRAIIAVVDRTAGPLKAIDARLAAAGSPLRDLGKKLAEVGEHSGLARLAEAGRRAGERFKELGRNIRELAGPLEVLGAAATVAGLTELVKHAAEYGAALYDAALKTGVAADQLARLHFAAQITGTDAGALDHGLERLNRTIGDTVSGKNQEMALMFSRLHISLRDSEGKIRSGGQVLGDLAEAVKRNKESPVILAEIAKAMGARSGAELLPLLRQGKDGLAALGAEAEHFGLVMSAEGVANAKEFDDSLKKVGFSVQGLSNAIGEKLFPILRPMLTDMADWIAANRQVIATKITGMVSTLGEVLRSINWGAIKAGLSWIAAGFAFVSRWIGPTTLAIGLATIAMAPLIMAFLGANIALVRMGWALGGVALRLGLLAFAEIAGAIGMFIQGLRAGIGVVLAFDAALAANPIGLVIIGITALVAAGLLLWKYWAPISGLFKGMWDGIIAAFDLGWGKIKPIIDAVSEGAHAVARVLGWRDLSASATARDAAARGAPLRGADDAGGGAADQRGETQLKITVEDGRTKIASRSTGNAPAPDISYTGFAMAPGF